MDYHDRQIAELRTQVSELRAIVAAETGDTKNAPDGWAYRADSDGWLRNLPSTGKAEVFLVVEQVSVGSWAWYVIRNEECSEKGHAARAYDGMMAAQRAAAPLCKCNGTEGYVPHSNMVILHDNGPCPAHPDAEFTRLSAGTGNYGAY